MRNNQSQSAAPAAPVSPQHYARKAALLLSAALGCAGPALGEAYYFPAYGEGFDFGSRYNSVQILDRTGGTALFSMDVNFRDAGFQMWRSVQVGDASVTAPVDMVFKGFNIGNAFATGSTLPLSALASVGSLDITQARVTLDNMGLVLGASDSTLNLRNASLTFDPLIKTKFSYDGTGRLSINALSGNNTIARAPGSVFYQPVSINVSPGASLNLQDFRGFLDDPNQHLHFKGQNSNIDVDGGRLILERTRLYVDHGSATFKNGAELFITGSEWAGGGLDRVGFLNSRLTMDHITDLTANQLIFMNSTATLGGVSRLAVQNAIFSGDSQIIGATPPGGIPITSELNITNLTVFYNASLRVTGVSDATFTNLEAWRGSTLGLIESTQFSRTIKLMGGALDIGANATLFLRAETPDNNRFTAYLKPVEPGSSLAIRRYGELVIGRGSSLILDDQQMVTTNDGIINIRGSLAGDGSVLGVGAVTVSEGGLIAPSYGTRYASVHLNNTLYLNQGAQFQLNLQPGWGLPSKPLVTYGAGPVIYTGKPIIEVRGNGALNAAALAGQSITILAAQSAGVTGTINTNGFSPMVKPVDMPALLAYSVGDTSTNGKPDVTLFIDGQPVSAIQRHSSLTTKNRQGVADLLVTAAAVSPAVNAMLNTVTNEQLAGPSPIKPGGVLDQLHPEPYSSYITVNLEALANTRNLIFMRAMNTDPQGERVWMDISGSRGHINGQAGLGSFDYQLAGLTVGKDFGALLGGAWGGYLSFGQMRMNENDIANQRLSGQSYGAGVYGHWQQPGWESRALLGYAYGDHNSTREFSFNNLTETFRAKYSSNALQAAVRASFDWIENKAYELRPEIGGSITSYRQAALSETGGSVFGLNVSQAHAESYIAHAGLNGLMPRISESVAVRPIGFLRYEYDFADSTHHAIDASLQANPGYSQTFIGQGRGPSTVMIGLGFLSDSPGPLQISGGIAFARHTYGNEWGGGINLRYSW